MRKKPADRTEDPLLTDIGHASGWYGILPEPDPAVRLTGNQTADWVIVGAGVTGLAAARRLAELNPDARILLLDMWRVGYGASGRNAGFIIDTPHLTEQLDTDANRRISRLVVAGLAELERQVKEHDIDCEWSPRGHLTAIVDPGRVDALRSTARTLEESGEQYKWLQDRSLSDVVGTDFYRAAVFTPRTVLVNPAAMCRGLGDALPANVEIYEETPVLGIAPGLRVRIECADSVISATNVLLTTNAYIHKLDYLRNDVFPLMGCASLSRVLTEKERSTMGGVGDWGITGYATLRRTLSNRILVRHGTYPGSNICLTPDRLKKLRESHLYGLRRRFPQLSNLEFEHTWAGAYAMTRNWASFFGRLDQGVFASLGYCGGRLAPWHHIREIAGRTCYGLKNRR